MANIIKTYKEDVQTLVTGSVDYTLPIGSLSTAWTQEDYNLAFAEFQAQLQAGVDITGVYSNKFPNVYPIGSLPGDDDYYPVPDQSVIGTPNPNANTTHKIKVNILKGNRFLGNFLLRPGKEFYTKGDNLYLRPNELLDRQNFPAANYTLQYDFIHRYQERPNDPNQINHFYITEISNTRKEIRLERKDLVDNDETTLADRRQDIESHLNEGGSEYTFNSFIELPFGRFIPINGYAFDSVTGGKLTLILRLNAALPTNIENLFKNFHITNKFYPTQTEDIIFKDEEGLVAQDTFLPIDTSYLEESDNTVDSYDNYTDLTGSLGNDLISEFTKYRNDKNLNIDYTKYDNHTFFGSARRKLVNFKNKAVKLEGIYSKISSSLALSSSRDVVLHRKDLFNQATEIKSNFTSYERFLYNDNQETSNLSAPGLGFNKAGSVFNNGQTGVDYATGSVNQDYQGFDKVHIKETTSNIHNHVFSGVFQAEQPPFFNTNRDVYLSFIASGKNTSLGSSGPGFEVSGGLANVQFGVNEYFDYNYKRNRVIPFEAYKSGSSLDFAKIQNPFMTGSEYRRFIFKGRQNNWRPKGKDVELVNGDIFNMPIESIDETGASNLWSGSNNVYYQVLTGSEQVFSSSVSGSVGDGFAYGIKDSSGQHTPYLYPLFKDDNNLSTTFIHQTSSVLPQGDLFPIFVNKEKLANGSTSFGRKNNQVIFTDVKVSYNNPTNIHPFSEIYRPPSGSYNGSSEWNNWYTGALESASLYDTNNIHSLVNNLPLPLRTEDEHEVLRAFVDMLGEQFDLLRNYIDNYHNFYKLGYTNPGSIPDNLLPIIGDSLGWKLMNPFSSSLADYAASNVEDGGVQGMINQTWKKIINNIVYVYKVKGSSESIKSLLNLYGFDGTGFKMREYGGSTAEHNPTIITNDSQDFLDGMKKVKGNVSFVQEVQPFPMMNFRGTNSLGIDWWRNDAEANGIEFVFNAEKSGIPQTILRSSGSSNDLWDLRIVPSGSSKDISQIQFRLNTSPSGSGAIASNAISMSTAFSGNFTTGSIWNLFLQRDVVTGSNPSNSFTQSYHMFVARKDDDKIKEVSHISMSTHLSGSNYNFTNEMQSKTANNLFVGESLSGSLSELRTWNAYVSMSKFKQHVINYQSIVGNKITSSVDDLLYRYKFDENIVNWSKTPNSQSLKLHDANSQKVKDYSILIASQDNFNYKTTMTEQVFYKLTVKGTDSMPNDNQTNLVPKMSTTGQLNPDQDIVDEPRDSSGQQERQYSNKFGREMSYVNAINSLVMNQLPDFRIDDFIGDPDEDLTDTYEDLLRLRKSLLGDTRVSIDVGKNIKSAEDLLSNTVVDSINSITPAKTKMELSYDIKNDTLYRSKIGKKMKMTPQLNPNKAIGVIDADKFDEPTVVSFANNNVKEGKIDADQFDEPTVTSFVNNNLREGKIDADQWDEPSVVSFVNNKVHTGNIDADKWDEPTLNASYQNVSGESPKINYVDLSNSVKEASLNVTAKVGSHDMNQFFLGPKNHIGKNQGTGVNNRFFKSGNPGVDGNFNTYKFENRFTFKTIGDTERFHNSASHHDVYDSFVNRHFVDQNHPQNYVYNSLFGSDGAATVNGRMVGRTRFFRTDADGNITYPSNHYINARTSKDRLIRLTYLGTQHTGANPTQDPIEQDPQPKISAYTIRVAGSDTVQRIKVERPISVDLTKMRLRLDGQAAEVKFELFKRNKLILSQNLHSTNQGGLNRIENVEFNLVGEIGDYNFKITPITANRRMESVRVFRRKVNEKLVRNASITSRRLGGIIQGRFTRIKGPFLLRFVVR